MLISYDRCFQVLGWQILGYKLHEATYSLRLVKSNLNIACMCCSFVLQTSSLMITVTSYHRDSHANKKVLLYVMQCLLNMLFRVHFSA